VQFYKLPSEYLAGVQDRRLDSAVADVGCQPDSPAMTPVGAWRVCERFCLLGSGDSEGAAGGLPNASGDGGIWHSIPPEVPEPVGRKLGVSNSVLDVLVPEVVLQSPRVVAIVGELEPTGMAKHVRVDREWHLGGLPEALDKPMEPDGTDGPAALGNEYVGVSRVIAA
jgi:hypothetical protein